MKQHVLLSSFTADLHIHSCLSPCGELDLTPRRIIDKAMEKGLDIIAIADHNSAENLEAAARIAAGRGIAFLPAMEITSAEEVHVLALFGRVEDALGMQQKIYGHLMPGENDERLWGEQVVVNAQDEVLGFNKRLLSGATTLALVEIAEAVHAMGGLAVASHVDRGAFSVISQLGFIPDDVRFDALEFVNSPRGRVTLPYITNSDAHRLEDVGQRTTRLLLKEPTFAELGMALRGEGGRAIIRD